MLSDSKMKLHFIASYKKYLIEADRLFVIRKSFRINIMKLKEKQIRLYIQLHLLSSMSNRFRLEVIIALSLIICLFVLN